jgi:hypothetical protein
MKTIKFVSLMLIAIVSIMGCSGKTGKFKSQSIQDSKATQQELVDKWSDYDIWIRNTVIVFDPKNDDKKILVGSYWGTVKDQETWSRIVKENTTSDGDIDPVGVDNVMTGVREIWGPENQFYAYVIHQQNDLVGAEVVDENTMRLFYHYYHKGRGP